MTNTFPTESALYPEIAHYQYADSFAIPIQKTDIETSELVTIFFQSAPRWVGGLLVVRNRIARFFGLKSGRSNPLRLVPPIQVGKRIGLFRIISLTESEAIIGEDDSHLDFRISLLLIQNDSGSQLIVSTLVKTKNGLGVAYFWVVKRFHRLIVPIMVRAMAKRIEERSRPKW